MEIGLALPHYDFSVPGENPLSWETVVGVAHLAEAAGADALYVSDHLFLDIEKYGGGPGVYGTYEALVTLAALGRVTERVRLGTLVLCEALRPAGVLAKTLATLDRVVGGRLDVGLGAGWYEPEYAAIGMAMPPPGERLARLAEATQIVTALLGGGPATFEGRYHSVRDAVALPPALQQPRPRVFLGGKGDRLLRLVARHADGWNTVWVWTPATYAERLASLEAACETEGRDPASVWRTLGLYTLVGEDAADLDRRYRRMQAAAPGGMLEGVPLEAWREGRLVGTVDEVREQVATWEGLGVEQLVLCVGPLPFSVSARDDVELALAATAGTFG
jgi:alkanesulfonate monooxygenase SsuD/methylene tetrahydromethanopterin reductase-like flavin-dependent oxidoreductase (luciferase family)